MIDLKSKYSSFAQSRLMKLKQRFCFSFPLISYDIYNVVKVKYKHCENNRKDTKGEKNTHNNNKHTKNGQSKKNTKIKIIIRRTKPSQTSSTRLLIK